MSFREDVFKDAEKMADKFFGGNFSAYITYLICADKHGVARVIQTEEIAEAKEEIAETFQEYEKSDANDSFIDDILNME